VAGFSLGIEVGMIGGGRLGETDPVLTTTVLVVEEVVVCELVVEVCELIEVLEALVAADDVLEPIW